MRLYVVLRNNRIVLGTKYRLYDIGPVIVSDGRIIYMDKTGEEEVRELDIPDEYIKYVNSCALLYDGTTFVLENPDLSEEDTYIPDLDKQIIPNLNFIEHIYERTISSLITSSVEFTSHVRIKATPSNVLSVSGFEFDGEKFVGNADELSLESKFISEILGSSVAFSHFSIVLLGWLPDEFTYEYTVNNTSWNTLSVSGYATAPITLTEPSDVRIRLSGTFPTVSKAIPVIKEIAIVY